MAEVTEIQPAAPAPEAAPVPPRPTFPQEMVNALIEHAASAPLSNMKHAAAIDRIMASFHIWYRSLPAELKG